MFKYIILPITGIYTLLTSIRNKLFENNILKSISVKVFTINVGNLRVGGTGKTPVSSWLLQNLQFEKKAFLSRGYGRKSKGFKWISEESTTEAVGDEPKMLFEKLKNKAIFAVDEQRIRGAITILNTYPDTKLIVLDDAYQHRYLKSNFNILLTTWKQPFFEDRVLPAGRLREHRRGAKRAHAVLVTKCPLNLDHESMRNYREKINKYADDCPVYFLNFKIEMAFNHLKKTIQKGSEVGLISALALNQDFEKEAGHLFCIVKKYQKSDHYSFKKMEIERLLAENPGLNWICTEKDYVKLKEICSSDSLKSLYYLPQEITFLKDEKHFISLVKSAYNSFYGHS